MFDNVHEKSHIFVRVYGNVQIRTECENPKNGDRQRENLRPEEREQRKEERKRETRKERGENKRGENIIHVLSTLSIVCTMYKQDPLSQSSFRCPMLTVCWKLFICAFRFYCGFTFAVDIALAHTCATHALRTDPHVGKQGYSRRRGQGAHNKPTFPELLKKPNMWTEILTSLATIGSGVMSALNNKKMESSQSSETARRTALYEREANQNPLFDPANAELLGTLDRKLHGMNETAAAKTKVTGGTQEQAVANQKANAAGYANAVSAIASNASSTRAKAMENLEKSHEADFAARQKFADDRNATYKNLFENAANAASGMADFGGMRKNGGSDIYDKTMTGKHPNGKDENPLSGYIA